MDNCTGIELGQPLISVVIAVYNGQDVVGQTISSVSLTSSPMQTQPDRVADAKEHLRRAAELIPAQRRVRLRSAIAHLPGGTRWLVNRPRADDRRVGRTERLHR